MPALPSLKCHALVQIPHVRRTRTDERHIISVIIFLETKGMYKHVF